MIVHSVTGIVLRAFLAAVLEYRENNCPMSPDQEAWLEEVLAWCGSTGDETA